MRMEGPPRSRPAYIRKSQLRVLSLAAVALMATSIVIGMMGVPEARGTLVTVARRLAKATGALSTAKKVITTCFLFIVLLTVVGALKIPLSPLGPEFTRVYFRTLLGLQRVTGASGDAPGLSGWGGL
jgi:hypothetical protein